MSKDVIKDLLWTEKYRPTSLEQLALDPDVRAVLQSYLDAGEIPHLLMIGPAGSGKTTVARILYRSLDAQVLTLNASAERGIDTVRNKIGVFVGSILGSRWNIVFLDEADAMTNDAQTSLRNLIEAHADRARFILTANFGSRIIGPIQSRCQILHLDRPPIKERYRILAAILKQEGIEATPQVMLTYVERYPDLRRMLFAAQQAYLARGELPPAKDVGGVTGHDQLKWIEGKNWGELRTFAAGAQFEAQAALHDLFYAIPDEHPKCGYLRWKIGRSLHETGFSPDPVVLYLAAVAEVMVEGV